MTVSEDAPARGSVAALLWPAFGLLLVVAAWWGATVAFDLQSFILPSPGEVVSAFIRPAAGHKVNREELFDYVREHLAPHKTPRHWFAVEAMPLTGSGKIQKFKLREQWKNGEFKEL